MPEPVDEVQVDEAREPRRAAARKERSLLRDFFRPSRGQFVVGLALFLTALIVVLTLRSQATQPEFANVRQADLIQLLDNVTGETRRLEEQVRELERSRTELLSGADRDQAAREEAARRLEQARIIAGTVPAAGPGIRIEIQDPGERVTAELLLNAVEELRDAGAEVIELNDAVRLVMNSYFAADESGAVTADGVALAEPYVIDAIGDPATLEAGARFRGGLVSEIEGERVGGRVAIEQLEDVDISSVVEIAEPQFARPR
ncbi:DUF881 domain-containing protein [Tessaracoccus sp. MC1756]|uniref:DUF881 domain-containing protein n=1 Tax=Tessaracoccus sp. MC1756 TaxID=2760311 RepID=UPI001603E37F|nr:DUF881 domain-containing protein [Tessaracoccus sp. MC1756]MBB1509209.1 DUF881 domain-containing protein [Tessaracoccus sp. MC1756]